MGHISVTPTTWWPLNRHPSSDILAWAFFTSSKERSSFSNCASCSLFAGINVDKSVSALESFCFTGFNCDFTKFSGISLTKSRNNLECFDINASLLFWNSRFSHRASNLSIPSTERPRADRVAGTAATPTRIASDATGLKSQVIAVKKAKEPPIISPS